MMSPSPTREARRATPRSDGPATVRPVVSIRRGAPGVSKDLFPLPLSSMEQLFLTDELPSFPMQFFCRLRFQGRLQRQHLDAALSIAVARHPLLSAMVRSEDGPQWLACPNPLPEVQWFAQEPPDGLPPASSLDLRTQPGLKLAAFVGASRSDLILQFHHATCDGIGAFDFITDLLTAYANAASETKRYRFKSLDTERLRNRGAWPISGWQLGRWGIRRLPSLRALWRFFRRKPAPLIPHRPDLDELAPPPAFPEVCMHHFDRAESAGLARLAHGSETTLNGLLLRDLMVALAQWRQRNGLPLDDWLRLMVPINLRTPADRRLSATNSVSMFFLDHRLSDALEPEKLLQKINSFLADIKRNDLGLAWLLGLRILQNVLPKAWEKARLSRRRCLYSTLLTNIGPVLAGSPLPRTDRRLIVGDLTLDDVEFVPLVRPLQCLGFAVSTYAGKMSLGMRYDSRVMNAEQAEEVLDAYVAAVRTSIQSVVVLGVLGTPSQPAPPRCAKHTLRDLSILDGQSTRG